MNWTGLNGARGSGARQMRRGKRNGLLMLPFLMGLASCQTTTPSGGIETGSVSFCQAAKAIYYSRHDTPPTIAQIREHNAVGVALKCGWVPAKKRKG